MPSPHLRSRATARFPTESDVSLDAKRDAALAVLGTRFAIHRNSTFHPREIPLLTEWKVQRNASMKPDTAEEIKQ